MFFQWFVIEGNLFQVKGESGAGTNLSNAASEYEYNIRIKFNPPVTSNRLTFIKLSGFMVMDGKQCSYFTANRDVLKKILNVHLKTNCREGAGNSTNTSSCISEIVQPLELPDNYKALINQIAIINDPKFEIIN